MTSGFVRFCYSRQLSRVAAQEPRCSDPSFKQYQSGRNAALSEAGQDLPKLNL